MKAKMTGIISNLISCVIALLIIMISCLVVCSEGRFVLVNAAGDGFVERKGTEFVLNGSPFLFNGFNSYWMMNVAADPKQRSKVSNLFGNASSVGLTVCRTWAFSDAGNQPLQISPGLYNENMFHALDFVVAEAKKNGVRLILSLVNNYNEFGGRPQYVQWAKSSGVPVNNDDDFYTNPLIKGYYKNHVKRVLTRVNPITGIAYMNEPTIMAWELINEPRCQVDYSGKTINAWVQEMAPYVKSIDNKHLLEVGLEGFYGDSVPGRKQYNPGFQVGTDFLTNNLIKEIDFATIHAYADNWLNGRSDTVQMAFMGSWMTSHLQDSRTMLKKPLVLTEFGKSKKDPGYSIEGRDSFMNNVYSSIYNLAQNNGGTFGGGLVWQLLDEGMDQCDDGYEIILSQHTSTTSIISGQSSRMVALAHSLQGTRG